MLLHVLAAVEAVEARRTVVVLGHGAEQILPHLPAGCVVAIQEQQKGTGHAVLAAEKQLLPGAMMVIPGDTPLVTGEVLRHLAQEHRRLGASATVLTMILDDPSGYGRIVRDSSGAVNRIVEHRDATDEERAIREVNTGMFVLPVPLTLEILKTVGSDNDQGEIYLTDVIAGLVSRGERVAATVVADPESVLGVNSPAELAEAERILGDRIKRHRTIDGTA
jgi:bifunctional UDP-N-acetylglucosamine pyrophosphorylase/glucosamine-1-phosphate N-acetyltransferase